MKNRFAGNSQSLFPKIDFPQTRGEIRKCQAEKKFIIECKIARYCNQNCRKADGVHMMLCSAGRQQWVHLWLQLQLENPIPSSLQIDMICQFLTDNKLGFCQFESCRHLASL